MKTNRNQWTWIPVIILILSGVLLIGGVSASEFGPWSTQTVDSNGKVGQYSSVALDAAGNPAISYYDETYGDLKYASWNGSKWVITTVDASRRGGGWGWGWGWGGNWDHDSDYIKNYHGTEKVGEHSSLAFDSSGKPRISYYDQSEGDLKYASWDGSKWVITTVDGTNYKKDGQIGCNWDGDYGRAEYNSINVGKYSSLALDSNDKPRISYYDETHGILKYASWDGSKWVITTVDASKSKSDSRSYWGGWGWGGYQNHDNDNEYIKYYHGTENVGEYSSLALDSSGKPRISYHDEGNEDLKYASWDGSKWVITTVDGTNYKKGGQIGCNWDGDHGRDQYNSINVGDYSSLALNSTGSPRISYYDETNKDLKYASWDGSRWVITTVDSARSVGEYSSLELNAKGDPRISYYDASNGNLKFAAWNRTNSLWVTEIVDSSRKVGTFTSLALDSLGNPCISYYDQSNKDLKYAGRTGQTQHPVPVANFVGSPTTGTAPLTVTFTDRSTNTPISWRWDFGDNSSVNATVQNPVHTFGSTGTYTVKLNATNSAGSNTSTQTNYITVNSGVVTPVANFVGSPTTGTAPLTVIFTDSSTNTPISWSWDFGDNSAVNATVQNPVHTFGSAGTYTVKLTATNSAGSDTKSNTNYIIVNPTVESPTFTSITPASGPIAGGTAVTIVGTNFAAGVVVTIGGANAAGVFVDSTHITAVTPSGTAGARDVVITNTDGQTVTGTGAYTYVAPPTFTSITPNSGSTLGGTTVTIVGTNFVNGIGVTIGGAAATNVNVVDATSITAVTPAGTIGAARDVVITNTYGQTVTGTGAYTYVIVPTVTSLLVDTGTAGTTLSVSIAGTNFGTGTTVWLAKGTDTIIPTSLVVNSPTLITCTFSLPAPESNPYGKWDVVVKNADGQSSQLNNGFIVKEPLPTPAPTVTLISPANGIAGTSVTITLTGTNFVVDPPYTTVWLAKETETNIPTGIVVNSPTQITCKFMLPALSSTSASKWDVVVKNPDAQKVTMATAFEVKNPTPTVTGINPNSGIAGNLVTATIAGTNFVVGTTPTVSLTKGSVTIPVTVGSVVSSNQITCTFTLPAPADNPAGQWDVNVTNADGQTAIMPTAFTVANYPPPTVTGISPNSGVAGENPVTVILTGTQFVTGTTVKLVKSDASALVATNSTVNSPTQITCTLPLPELSFTSAGDWDVVVSYPDGQTAIKTTAFTITNPAPSVTSIIPYEGKQGDKVTITLVGKNFVVGGVLPTVQLKKSDGSENTAITVTVVSPTEISCKFRLPDTASLGRWDVVVKNADNKMGKLPNAFEVLPA